MWGRHERLIRLYEELAIIAVLDRLDDYSTEPNRTDKGAWRSRQGRRSGIFTEIASLEAKKPWFEEGYAKAGAIILLLIFASPAIY